MCGGTSRQSFGGALAVLSLPMRSTRGSPAVMAGRLTFHDKGKSSLVATHATFTAGDSQGGGLDEMDGCVVGIHETGDLTRSAIISPFLHKFSMRRESPSPDSQRGRTMDVRLCEPMKIEVGGDGIIGRRVTVWTRHGMDPVAEGVIGYN